MQYGFSMSGNPNDDVFPLPADGETTSASTTRDSPQDSSNDSEGSLPAGLLGAVEVEAELDGEGSQSEAESESMSSILQAADRIRASGDVASESSDDDATAMRLHSVSKSLLRRLAQRRLSESSPKVAAIKDAAVEESSRSLLLSLLEEVQTLSGNYPSSLDEDSALLLRISSNKGPLVAPSLYSVSTSASSLVGGLDSDGTSTTEKKSGVVMLNKCQLEACIRQRIERKQLLLCAQNVLKEALSALNA